MPCYSKLKGPFWGLFRLSDLIRSEFILALKFTKLSSTCLCTQNHRQDASLNILKIKICNQLIHVSSCHHLDNVVE